ncbi:orotate phosphoribosyltransferase [candidate division KSB1 bacterium]|nr:orotate phosphoribosyltransferase [candidate division KSB1 bacterium]
MTEQEILQIFAETEALLTGHFILTSGLHSNRYFQGAKVLQHPEIAAKLCSQIGEHFKNKHIDAVIAPAVGGIIVTHEVAKSLGVRAIFSERQQGEMTLRRGFEIKKGENLLVVEDVITTGGSVKEVIDLVKASGGNLAGAGCLVDRSGGQVNLGTELFSLVKLTIQTFPPENCELCKQGSQAVKPGSRGLSKNG